MTTIQMKSPRNAKEVKNLAWARKKIESVETELEKVMVRDNTEDDFNPSKGEVAVADLKLGRRTTMSGVASFDSESGELRSASLEKIRPVEIEVDHLMWGSYRGESTIEISKSPECSSYIFHDEVGNKITRDFQILVDHKNDTLSFDFEQEKARWVRRTRGL